MGIEAIYECGLFEKALDEWEDLAVYQQNWSEFQSHFQEAEEKFNLKQHINNKKGSLGRANSTKPEDMCEPYTE